MNVIRASLLGAGLWSALWAAPNVAIAQDTQVSDASAEAAAASRVLRRLSGQIARYPEIWVAAVVAINRRDFAGASGPASAVNATAAVTEAQSAPADFRLPDTRDHVRITAAVHNGQGHDEIVVTLDIDEGYHINANPASLDYLIPTSVSFGSLTPSRIIYPTPVRFEPAFVAEGFDVYEGTVKLVAIFPAGTLKKNQAIRAVVTAQACNDRICLPPAELSIRVVVD